jgi:hypothetical protein
MTRSRGGLAGRGQAQKLQATPQKPLHGRSAPPDVREVLSIAEAALLYCEDQDLTLDTPDTIQASSRHIDRPRRAARLV